MTSQAKIFAAVGAACLLFLFWSQPSAAYGGFNDGGGAGQPACGTCHTNFQGSGGDHGTHAALTGNNCSTCHGGSFNNNPPLDNCVTCHGRAEDAGGDSESAGIGRGLRRHHVVTTAAACDACHSDAALTAPAGVGEHIAPAFYASSANTLGLDACDGSEERFASASVSLDNDGDGQTDGADSDCTPNQDPVANPGGPYNASAGSPVSFDGTGSSDPDGTIASYAWDFGDGNGGSGATTQHTYAAAGTYTVTLTVTDDANGTNAATTTATITAQPLPPLADAGPGYSGTVGSPISFDGSGSSDPDGTIVAYAWDFGDGGTGSGPMPTHTYSVDGTFTVTLTVTDDDGLTDVDTATATVSPAGVNAPPTANANGPYSGTEQVEIQFSSAGSSDPDGTIVAYAWDFGDGSRSSLQNPVHAYVAAGVYNVTLTVTDDAGATDTAATTATIEAPAVNAPPVADANGPYMGNVGDAIMFDGSGSSDADGVIVAYDWDFGDGNSGTGVSPSHSYASAGMYTVTLMVTDDSGATDSASTSATINEPAPVTDGETQYLNFCAGCHGDPWDGPAVDDGLPGVHRVAGARACSIDASIFGTYVFPDGAPGMQFLQPLANDGTIDSVKIAEYLNSQPVTGEQYYVTACAGCHGDDGSGGRTDEDVRGEDASEIIEAIHDEDTMLFLACLPDSDIEAMADFLGGARRDDDEEDEHDRDHDKDEDEDKDDEKHDRDNDGLDDDEEDERGTDPDDWDSDDDGYSDGDEVDVYGTNPLSASSNPNSRNSSSGGGSADLLMLLLLGLAGSLRGIRRRQPSERVTRA